jgi:quinol monooxygenase YgiN
LRRNDQFRNEEERKEIEMAKELYVTAKFVAKKDRVTDLVNILENLASQTRAEAGCLDYGCYQSSDNPTLFTSFEKWENPEAEGAHWNTKHLKDALTQLPELMDGEPTVTKYHKIT